MKIKDRSGRTWLIENYQSPSGPAFCIEPPTEVTDHGEWPPSHMNIHFDGSIKITGAPQED